MVGISFNKGVVLYEQYFGSVITIKSAKIAKARCPNALKSQTSKLILMDGCPRQNAKLSLKAIKEIGALVFKIYPPSSSINPIENSLNFILQKLHQQAFDQRIKSECYLMNFLHRLGMLW